MRKSKVFNRKKQIEIKMSLKANIFRKFLVDTFYKMCRISTILHAINLFHLSINFNRYFSVFIETFEIYLFFEIKTSKKFRKLKEIKLGNCSYFCSKNVAK